MSNYHLHYTISERTPPSPKTLRAILDVQAEMNRSLTWTHECLSLAPRRESPRPGFAFSFSRFAPRQTFTPEVLGSRGGVATLAAADGFASGSTKVREDLWNAHLVAAFLRHVSAAHPEILFGLRDEGGFVLPGAIWIQDGKAELDREWLNRERERALEMTGNPEAAAAFVWAETQALEGRFFEEGNVFDYANVPEIRNLGATWEQLESSSLEEVANVVVQRTANEVTVSPAA